MRVEDIGGGVVKFGFRAGSKWLCAGTRLTADQICAFAAPNRQSLIDKGMLAVWPKSGDELGVVSSGDAPGAIVSPVPAQRHVVHTGRGQYDVIEGHKLNDAPLKKPDAQTLAGVPKDN